MADVNVVFGADTTQLDAAVTKVKTEMQSLTPGAPGSGILTPLPQAFGGAPSTLLERATAAAKANAAAAKEAGTAMKNYGLELEEAGNKAGRAGINFEAMAERMAARLVIFEAVRLAIQGIMAAFKEVSGFETAQVQFENLTKDAEGAAVAESALMSTVKATNQEFGKLVKVMYSIEDTGASIVEATAYTDLLGKRATATGQDVDKLGMALEHAKLNEATIPEMFELAHVTGTAKDALLDEVTGYAKLTEQIKQVDKARDEEIARMDIAVRQWEKEKEAAERTLSAQLSFTEKLIAAQNQWDQAHGRTTRSITEQFERASRFKDFPGAEVMLAPRGGWGGSKLPTAQVEEYRRGIAQMAQEEQTSAAQIHKAIRSHIIDYNDVMAAAKRSHEEERRGVEATAQAERDKAAETKRKEALALDKQRIQVQNDLVQAIGTQNNITGELGKTMGTVSEKFASIATSLKTIADESPQLLADFNKIADVAAKLAPVAKTVITPPNQGRGFDLGFELGPAKMWGDITGASGFGEIMKGLQGLGEMFSGKTVLTERNSNKIESHLSTIAQAFSGS